MKLIELTEEHKKKLSEMCKILFPEWDLKTYDENFDDLPNNLIRFKTKTGVYKSVTFHWFEFCVNKLFPKVNQWFNHHQLSNFLYQTIGYDKDIKSNEMNSFKHPVDFLYDEFNKMKS